MPPSEAAAIGAHVLGAASFVDQSRKVVGYRLRWVSHRRGELLFERSTRTGGS
jgi:hypothetical protein